MRIVTWKKEMQKLAKECQRKGKSIGFVPTMGYLHEGHVTLVKEARNHNDVVVMSIFVNPLQFGPEEDFEAYPRDPERDKQLAEEAGVDILFMPDAEEMYHHKPAMKMTVSRKTNILCGVNRPGHFDGVVTVLAKLFHLTLPDRAYFGLKDAQQFAVVASLVDDLDFPVELVPVETVREPSGLAVSSRNVNLTKEEKKQAPAIYKGLQKAKELIEQGENNIEVITRSVKEYMEEHMDAEIDYVELLSFPELERIPEPTGTMMIAAAVKFSQTRLIDNIMIKR